MKHETRGAISLVLAVSSPARSKHAMRSRDLHTLLRVGIKEYPCSRYDDTTLRLITTTFRKALIGRAVDVEIVRLFRHLTSDHAEERFLVF